MAPFRAVLWAAALAVSAGPALAGPSQEAIGQDSPAGGICRSIIGLTPGEAQFAACVQSLSQSWRDLVHARGLADARARCRDKGLRPSTPELAECVLDSSETAADTAPNLLGSETTAAPARSYFGASPTETHRREERACAALGYNPATIGFASCLANLQSALFLTDNPLN
jgi:hypothetical protein